MLSNYVDHEPLAGFLAPEEDKLDSNIWFQFFFSNYNFYLLDYFHIKFYKF